MDMQTTSDKQKQGGTGKDKDSIRASVLEEAVIVCIFGPLLNLKPWLQ